MKKALTEKDKLDYKFKFNFYMSKYHYLDDNLYYNNEKIYTFDDFTDYFEFLEFFKQSKSESEISLRVIEMINSQIQVLEEEKEQNNNKIQEFFKLKDSSFKFYNLTNFPEIKKHLEQAELYILKC